jgi:hypothetical protein
VNFASVAALIGVGGLLALPLAVRVMGQTPGLHAPGPPNPSDPSATLEQIKRVSIDVNLRPAEKAMIDVPLWAKGSLVTVRLQTPDVGGRPTTGTATKQGRRLTPTDIDDLLARRLDDQKRRTPIVSFALEVGGETLSPNRRFSGLTHFVVKVVEPASVGTAIITNVSGRPLRGRLLIASVDAAAQAQRREQRQRQQIAEAVGGFRNPDLLLIVIHTLKRHLQGFPGGASDSERAAATALAQAPPAALRRMAERLMPFEKALAARVRDRALATLSMRQGVSQETVRKTLKATAGQAGQSIPQGEGNAPPEGSGGAGRPPYNIRLIGIKSHRCADDHGYEKGCDSEEPYVVWASFGPGFARYGHTEDASGMTINDEFLYSQQTNVFSADAEGSEPGYVPTPFLFLYQVVESDPDSPSRAEVLEVVKAGLATVVNALNEDWKEAVDSGAPAFVDLFGVLMRSAGGGDDQYPVYAAAFDDERLLRATSGSSPGPLDQSLFESEGNYDRLSIRVPTIKSGGHSQWSLVYFILRQ